jgi:hypothetical protein
VEAALACTTATFVLLFPANLAPLMTVTMLGASHSSVLASGIVSMWNDGWVILAVLLGMFGIVLPFARFGGLMLVLAAIGFGWRFSGIGAVFRWSLALDAWAMPDVYLVGCIIGYVRVTHRCHRLDRRRRLLPDRGRPDVDAHARVARPAHRVAGHRSRSASVARRGRAVVCRLRHGAAIRVRRAVVFALRADAARAGSRRFRARARSRWRRSC